MKGLDLSENFYNEYGLPLFTRECPELLSKMAIGLVGDGSDCFGFDDIHSRDHDWGPAFCIWLGRSDMQSYGPYLQQLYTRLPESYNGFEARITSRYGEGRVGVLEIGAFYRRYLGSPGIPESLKQWLIVPENALATAVNGRVFHDQSGQFSAIRESLLNYYPEDVRLKKIAARCMAAGQAGQYNYPRCVKRSELYAAAQSEMKFLESALSLVFLLNQRYLPFYKWAHHAVHELPILGQYSYNSINTLMQTEDVEEKGQIIEHFSLAIINTLQELGMSESDSDFLPDHGPQVQAKIEDKEIRSYNILVG